MVGKKTKVIFLQDVRERSEHAKDMIGYMARDRLITVILGIVRKIDKDLERLSRLRKQQNLCEEERHKISSYLDENMSQLLDRKDGLMNLKQRIGESGKNVNLQEEIDSIMKATPIRE